MKLAHNANLGKIKHYFVKREEHIHRSASRSHNHNVTIPFNQFIILF